jgi:hypothetical protein
VDTTKIWSLRQLDELMLPTASLSTGAHAARVRPPDATRRHREAWVSRAAENRAWTRSVLVLVVAARAVLMVVLMGMGRKLGLHLVHVERLGLRDELLERRGR